jgi:hypothetical protein
MTEKGRQLSMRGHGSSGLDIAQFRIFNIATEAILKREIASMDPQSNQVTFISETLLYKPGLGS